VKPTRSAGLLALGLVAAGFVALALYVTRPVAAPQLTIAAGSPGTSRAIFTRTLAEAAGERLAPSESVDADLDAVNAGRVDLALVPGAVDFGDRPHLRQVAALHVEPLHLLVKKDLAPEISGNLMALEGKVVDVGEAGRTEARLAHAILEFVGLAPGSITEREPDALTLRSLPPNRLVAAAQTAADDQLPDAAFLLETLPSRIAQALVTERGYRLVPLRFAQAFALSALTGKEPGSVADSHQVDAFGLRRAFVYDTVIPAYTYDVEPAVPAEPLHTLGARLILVANENVAPASIERVLDAIFHTRVAHAVQPPLDPTLLSLPAELELHQGTLAYMGRDKPLITQDALDTASSTFSLVGASAGGLLFFWQWWRQNRRRRRDETFEAYILKVAAVERQATELELAAQLELEPLLGLQRELARLKADALDRFSTGELEGRELVSGFLTHANDTRDMLARLILHVRENLEERAEAEGRSAKSIWKEEAGSQSAASIAVPATSTPDASPPSEPGADGNG